MQDGVVQIELQLFQLVLGVDFVEQVQVFLDFFGFFVFFFYLFLEDIRLFEDFSVDQVIDHCPLDMGFLFLYLVFLDLFLQFLHLLLVLCDLSFGRRLF
jgi:hypothetical protein